MSEECGLRKLLCSCAQASRRSLSSFSPINPHSEEPEVLASSVEWLHGRVELLLSLPSSERPETPASLPRFSVPRHPAYSYSRHSSGVHMASVLAPRAMRQRRQRCSVLMHRLLKRLQSATRNPETAARLIEDDSLCHLLPLAICASFYDLPPESELLLARTLANLSCHQPSYALFSSDSFTCHVVDEWATSSCLVLSLCGRKIAANFSTYSLLGALSPGSPCRPYCIYQPDVYELARPFLAVPLMDVVFVNGMLGSVFFTWKQGEDSAAAGAGGANGGASVASSITDCWPRDWLAEDLPKARVLALNLKIAAMKWRGCSRRRDDPASCLTRRAAEAAAQLIAAGVGNRPTAFVCHSFGGLIVKQLLQLLHTANEDPVKKRLLASVRGLVFISVPHLGRSQAVNVNKIYWRPVRRLLLSEEASHVFDGSCRVLSRLHAWFVQYAQTRADLRVLNLIETGKTPVAPGGISLWVCPETWVDKLVGDVVRIPTNHILICKPPTRQHESYASVLKFLANVSNFASGWRPTLLTGGSLEPTDWHKPVRNIEEELRLRYGVSSARELWSSSAWRKFSAKWRPRFYDML